MLESLFLQILRLHQTAAVVILAVLAVRLLLRHAPKKWSYALWSVVGFRLICPVSFASTFSLFNLQQDSPAVQQPGGPYLIPGPTAVYPVPEVPLSGSGHGLPLSSSVSAAAADPAVSALQIAAVVWLVGIVLLLVYSIISYVNLKQQMTTAVRLEENVWQSDRIRSPFILGILRPKIYLPFGLEPDTQRYVLTHERCHLRHRDHWVKPLAFLLLTVHWFDPLVWLSFSLMGKDMELRTDEEVLSGEQNIRKAYSLTLLSFATNRRFPAPGPLAFGESGVGARIKNALRWKRPKRWVTVLSAVLCVAVIASCAADPMEAADEPTCTVTVNEESMDAQYYSDGFDYDYDKLMSIMPYEAERYTLTFDVSWETDHLTVMEGYYHVDGQVAQVTHTLHRDSDGRFRLEVPAPRAGTECAAYFISAEVGVFVTKVYFQPNRFANVTVQAEQLSRTGATILLQYTGKDSAPQTGDRFWLERMDGSDWVPVNANADSEAIWHLLAYDIGKEPVRLECDWSRLYGMLPDGIYRLGKEITDGDKTMHCYFFFTFPAYLSEPTCPVTVSGLDETPVVRWFPDGFHHDYDLLTPVFLPCQDSYELVFSPSWDCDVLTVGQDFYTRNGTAGTAYCETFRLERSADGTFTFPVSRRTVTEEEHAYYYIPCGDGKFVFQLNFAAAELPADPLEAAIHDAILTRRCGSTSDLYFPCESHVTLAHMTSDGRADQVADWRGQDVVYLMVLYQELEITPEGIRGLGGSHMPVRLTFDRYADGRYVLQEYWTPGDGTEYQPSIEAAFPPFLHADAMDNQKYILPQVQACYAQAIAHSGLDTEPIIEALFAEIAASPADASVADEYLRAHSLAVRELTYYGDYTLEYIFRKFLEGGQTGLQGHLMQAVMGKLIGSEAVPDLDATGQDYFDRWRSRIHTELETHGDQWLRENRPKGHLLIQMENRLT